MARSFNGLSDGIDMGLIRPAGAFTVVGWFNPSSLANDYASLVCEWNATGFGVFLRNTGAVALYGTSTPIDPSTKSLSTGTWSHVALTVSAQPGTATIYVNASSGGSKGIGTITWPTAHFQVGSDSTGVGGTFFPGKAADVAIWQVALTIDELTALAAGIRPFMIRPLSLLGYWPLDGLSSPESDLSGNKANGTLTGTALAAGPPTTLFTPKPPIFSPLAAPTAAQIYAFDQMAARFSRNITTIGY